MAAPNPMIHHCDLGTLDYSQVEHREIRCLLSHGGCGAVYELDPERGWQRSPRPIKVAARG